MMGYRFILAGVLALNAVAPAIAQDEAEEVPPKWSVTVTPRVQNVFFLPDADADGLETLISAGASVSLRNPDGRFGVTATYLYGKGNGTYVFDDSARRARYAYRGNRRELALLAEYTPSETNVTIIGGYHRFSAKARETLIDGGADVEDNDYDFSIDAAEIGLRLASRLGAQSRHAVSAQFSFGLGLGHYKEDETATFAGVTRVSQRDTQGIGYIGDIALGYNYFLTDRLTIGTRGRGYVFYVQTKGAYPIFAIAPELNMSMRF
ncbi:hypothetical protein [Sphingobium boeckii]|uniref:DUF481 domain-containing protein n=1 Tax=Sphingobium boeckii TaxID=1082345 RepID=A0A7W9EE50_9SPHN|nr:hypothetical protein [Sphingobium boeckii]MBB5685817.1 hypothetical protein [Sphingobium boeckii]